MAIKVGDRVREIRLKPKFADTGIVTAVRKRGIGWSVPSATVTWRVHSSSHVRQSDLVVLSEDDEMYYELDNLAAIVAGKVRPVTAYIVKRLCGHKEGPLCVPISKAVRMARQACTECRSFELL